MFMHLFINRLKILFRDKELIFWTLLFPLILATLFNMAFSKITSTTETFEPIAIAVVEDETIKENAYLMQTIEAVSKGEDRLFDLETVEEKVAKDKLLNGEIKGYLQEGKLMVKEDGLEQTILKSFFDQYYQKESMIQNIMKENEGRLDPSIIKDLMNDQDYIKKASYSKEDPDSTVNYFYSLLAMAALYGGFWGIKEVRDIQANQSTRASRLNLAPVHKLKTVLYNLAATLCINFSSILLLLAYMMFGLKIDFGMQLGYVILTCLIGCMTGVSMGMFIGVVSKKSDGVKIAILLAITMIGSFLAGMMYIDMRYIILTKAPILGYINPVNLLSDALYSLYYYDTYQRFLLDISILGVFVFVFLMGSYLVIRRQKYESI